MAGLTIPEILAYRLRTGRYTQAQHDRLLQQLVPQSAPPAPPPSPPPPMFDERGRSPFGDMSGSLINPPPASSSTAPAPAPKASAPSVAEQLQEFLRNQS